MSDSALEITNLIYTYAELLDAGDLDAVAGLFAHGRICGVENGPPETVFDGAAGVRKLYEMATRIYDDGTPKTKHLTTNLVVDVEPGGAAAACRPVGSVFDRGLNDGNRIRTPVDIYNGCVQWPYSINPGLIYLGGDHINFSRWRMRES